MGAILLMTAGLLSFLRALKPEINADFISGFAYTGLGFVAYGLWYRIAAIFYRFQDGKLDLRSSKIKKPIIRN
jgi:hypothetical protein